MRAASNVDTIDGMGARGGDPIPTSLDMHRTPEGIPYTIGDSSLEQDARQAVLYWDRVDIADSFDLPMEPATLELATAGILDRSRVELDSQNG